MADKQLGPVDRHNLDDLAWHESAARGAAEQARQNEIRAAAIARGEAVEPLDPNSASEDALLAYEEQYAEEHGED